MSNEVCDDNRYEIIEAAKQELIERTNIEMNPKEMCVIDDVLFRLWQMRWLPGQERTCGMILNIEVGFCTCKRCGHEFGIYEGYDPWRQEYTGKYCSNCGAKIAASADQRW